MRKYTIIGKVRGYIKLNYVNNKLIGTEKEYIVIKPNIEKNKVLVLK